VLGKNAEAAAGVGGLLVVATVAWAVAHHTVAMSPIANLDFWYMVQVGLALDVGQPATLADGLYPFGLPLLLRLGLVAGADVLVVGRVASAIGLAIALLALVRLVDAIEDDEPDGAPPSAWHRALVLPIALANPMLVYYAWFEGTDMLAAGGQVLGIALLAKSANAAPRRALLAGVAFGAAYLVRYTALVSLAACAVVLVGSLPWRRALGAVGRLFAGFGIAAAPQLAASLFAHGRPFYTLQAKNVWFGIHGGGDYLANWSRVPNDIAFLDVVAMDPWLFGRHWAMELGRFVSEPALHGWPLPLLVLAVGGAAISLAERRARARLAVRLILCTALAIVAATAMAWLHERFLLVVILLEVALIHRAILALADRAAALRAGAARPLLAAAALVLMLAAIPGARAAAERYADPRPALVARILAEHGMRDAAEVGTNNPYFHATGDLGRTRFGQINSIAPSAATLDDVLRDPRTAGWRFLALDFRSPHGDLSALRPALAEDPRVDVFYARDDLVLARLEAGQGR